MRNFIYAIRNNVPPNCDVELGVRVQAVVSLAESAYRQKQTMTFDEGKRRMTTGIRLQAPGFSKKGWFQSGGHPFFLLLGGARRAGARALSSDSRSCRFLERCLGISGRRSRQAP
jgi:hypothetical protein